MEKAGYREQLASILEFTGGKHWLKCVDVQRYTGLTFARAKKQFGIETNGISAEQLARKMC